MSQSFRVLGLAVLLLQSCVAFVPLLGRDGGNNRRSDANQLTVLFDARVPILQKALKRMQKLQEKCILPHQLAVKVDTSSIPNAGKGLFARQNIKAGTIVSFYPAHAIGVENDDGNAIYLSASAADQQYFESSLGSNLDYVQYVVGSRLVGDLDIGQGLFVDVNPSKIHSDGWASHYVNDGATVLSNTPHGILEYYLATRSRKNCVHIPFGPSPVLTTVTTRKVKKGEELFTSYGCLYWIEKILAEGEACTEILPEAQEEAKRAAQDLFQAMRQVQVNYREQEISLTKAFNADTH